MNGDEFFLPVAGICQQQIKCECYRHDWVTLKLYEFDIVVE